MYNHFHIESISKVTIFIADTCDFCVSQSPMACFSSLHTIIAKAGRVLLFSLCTILAPFLVVSESIEDVLASEEIEKSNELIRSWVDMKLAEHTFVGATVSMPPMTYIMICRAF